MKHLITVLILAVTTVGRSQSIFSHIPPEANIIIHANLSALVTKLGPDEVDKLSTLAQRMINPTLDIKTWVKDPATIGISLQQGVYFANSYTSTHTESGGYNAIQSVSLIVYLTDSGKFASFLAKTLPRKTMMGVAYNDRMGVLTLSQEMVPDSNGLQLHIASFAVKQSQSVLQGYANNFFATDSVFIKAFTDGGDVHISTVENNPLSLLGSSIAKMSPAVSKLTPLLQSRNRNINSVTFDAGSIVCRNTVTLPPDTAAVYAALGTRPLNKELIAHIPGNMIGFAALHFDPAAVIALLTRFNYRGTADSILAKMDLSVNDFVKAIKGDFLFAAVLPDTITDGKGKEKIPELYGALTVNDPVTLKKINDKLQLIKDTSHSVAYGLKNDIVVISQNKTWVNKYFNADKRNTDFITERMMRDPVSLYVDVSTVYDKYIKVSPSTSQASNIMRGTLNLFDKFIMTTGHLGDNNTVETYLELTFRDRSQNSLQALFQSFQKN